MKYELFAFAYPHYYPPSSSFQLMLHIVTRQRQASGFVDAEGSANVTPLPIFVYSPFLDNISPK
eukprot:scaffold5457_cov126-Skeletonema_dohrnii-CCMP3373.AAC.1